MKAPTLKPTGPALELDRQLFFVRVDTTDGAEVERLWVRRMCCKFGGDGW